MATQLRHPPRKLCAAAVIAACAGNALALDIDTGSDWTVSINTTATASTAWRASTQDKNLISTNLFSALTTATPPGTANSGVVAGSGTGMTGAIYAFTNPSTAVPASNPNNQTAGILGVDGSTGSSGPTRASMGDLNYNRGDRYAELYKFITDINVKKGNVNALVRVKGWYDRLLNNETVRFGAPNVGYVNTVGGAKQLADDGALALARFDGLEVLDAVVAIGLDTGDYPSQIRIGKQAINWGEGLFITGVNQVSPTDVAAARRPGAEIKETLLPIWAVQGGVALGDGGSLGAFYQMKWAPSVVETCGTYWAGGVNIAAHVGKCDNAGVSAVRWADGHEGKDSGQWGINYRFPVDAIDTEFGLYAININARSPVPAIRSTANAASGYFVAANANLFWEYPDDIRLYGLSAAFNWATVSWGAEISRQIGVPLSRNLGDINAIAGAATAASAWAFTARQAGLFAGASLANPKEVAWYDRFDKTMVQLNGTAGLSLLPQLLGAVSGSLSAEIGAEFNNVPDYRKAGTLRYGRAEAFGAGSFSNVGYQIGAGAGTAGLAVDTCSAAVNSTSGCKNDGFVTDSAWGYRLRLSVDYPNVFDSGFVATPSLSFSHDVDGISMDGQFQEGRQVVGLGLKLNRDKVHDINLGYAAYVGKWNNLRDRDNLTLSYSYSF